MPSLTPYDLLTDPSAQTQIKCYGMQSVPSEPADQEEILSSLSPLPPASLASFSIADIPGGRVVIARGTMYLAFPSSSERAYDLRGVALVYEGGSATIVIGYEIFDYPVLLASVGDFTKKIITITAVKGDR